MSWAAPRISSFEGVKWKAQSDQVIYDLFSGQFWGLYREICDSWAVRNRHRSVECRGWWIWWIHVGNHFLFNGMGCFTDCLRPLFADWFNWNVSSMKCSRFKLAIENITPQIAEYRHSAWSFAPLYFRYNSLGLFGRWIRDEVRKGKECANCKWKRKTLKAFDDKARIISGNNCF